MTAQFFKGMHELDPLRSQDAEAIFRRGFGNAVVPADVDGNGTVLYDPKWVKNKSFDNRLKIAKSLKAQVLNKAGTSVDAGLTGATGTGGAGTAGSALIPIWVDPNIVDQTAYETPLRSMIRRVAVRGKTYDFNIISAKGGAHWRTEMGALAEDVDTYDRVSVAMKFGYSVGNVTGPARAAMRGYVDADALDLAVKTAALFELEEDTIINGDLSTYATEYNGLIKSITTNTTAKGANVALSDIRNELDVTFQAKGRTNLIVTDTYTHSYIKGLLMDFQRQPAPPAENLPFGIPGAFEFDGVPVIKSQFMPTTTTARRVLFLDTRYLFMGVLLDITYEELPSPIDSSKYMLKVYEALCVQFEGAMSQIYTVT